MKKFYAILAIAVLGIGLGFIACGDDDDGGGNGGGAKFCLEECAVDGDCLTDYECQSKACVYTGTAGKCTGNDECIAMFSGWMGDPACTADADCFGGMGVCIDVGGAGYCTMAKTADCTAPMEAMTRQKLDGGADVEVCGRPTARCKDGTCGVPCTADADCPGMKCDTGTGDCYQCDTDADCSGGAMTKCLSSKFCGCASDAECTATGTDKCYSGACGCTSDAVCTGATAHPNTTFVCKGI